MTSLEISTRANKIYMARHFALDEMASGVGKPLMHVTALVVVAGSVLVGAQVPLTEICWSGRES